MTNRILQFMEVFDNSLKVGAPHEITTIEKLASSVAKGQGTLEGYHITEEDEMTSQDYGLDDPNQRQYNQPSDLSNEQPERNPLQDGISTEEERLREFHRTQQDVYKRQLSYNNYEIHFPLYLPMIRNQTS